MWLETKLMRDHLRVVAHDAFPVDADGNRAPLPPDFVMGVGGATETMLTLTPRTHVGRALDLGCGSGAQALFLNADRVVATDIDARALAAAAHSFHCSGFRKIDDHTWRDGDRLLTLLQGSLFEPVVGQRFDLIVSNPPFVIAGAGHTHRDSQFDADGLTRELLRQVPQYLNPRGVAVLLATWINTGTQSWEDRIASWIPNDVGVWIAQREFLNIDEYVQVWGDDAALDAAARDAWRTRLRALDVDGIGFGWIVLRAGEQWQHVEDVSMAARIPNGDEVLTQLTAFATERTAAEHLFGTWDFASEHWRGDLALDPFGAALVAELRSGQTLADAVDAVTERLPADPDDLRVLGLTLVRELARLGYLRPGRAPHGI